MDRMVGKNAYKLKLPNAMSRIHPVFNVVKLKAVPKDPIVGCRRRSPPEPVIVDGEQEYEVDEILDSRLRNAKLQFLVSWKGYGREENSWVSERDLHAPELIDSFYQRNPDAPRYVRILQRNFTRSFSPRRGGDVRGRPL